MKLAMNWFQQNRLLGMFLVGTRRRDPGRACFAVFCQKQLQQCERPSERDRDRAQSVAKSQSISEPGQFADNESADG